MIESRISRDMALCAALAKASDEFPDCVHVILMRGLEALQYPEPYDSAVRVMATAIDAAHAAEMAEIDRLTSELEALKAQMISLLNRTPFPWLEPAPTTQTKERT